MVTLVVSVYIHDKRSIETLTDRNKVIITLAWVLNY